LFDDVYSTHKPVLAVWNVFDLAEHADRMGEKHPDWSEAQRVCCLYWQGTARKQLRRKIEGVLSQYPWMRAETCPEAMGVDVTATMEQIGVRLEWPPKAKVIQVALLAHPVSL
jgi:hypothetical protein